MSEYKINLDVFAGPLDLLLYLVRKEEVDIYDIPLAKITEEYIRYVDVIKMLDVDTAGEFLVMAATLMEIKSAMLLPVDETDALAEEQGEDPRGELIRQLLEYKKFKDAANMLRLSAESQENKFPRSDNIIASLKPDAEPELDLDQLSVWDLLGAFDAIMKATGNLMDISHITDDTPIDLYQIEILHRLQTEGPMNFVRLFSGKKNRLVMVGMFLAILELTREKLITAEQAKPDMPIYLRPLTDEPAEQAVRGAMISQTQQTEAEEADQPQNHIAIEEIENKQTTAEPVVPIEEYEISASDNSALDLDRQEVISEQDSGITEDDKSGD
ncbi:MAG: segregation/condensation protein A [Phycisphaerae bacterium]|nr:segregation/condensation protein A [Phycisphaerae bacterium]